MGGILPQILIILSIGVIAYLVIKKFSYLASVDTENLPEEKQAELKIKILEERFLRQAKNFWQKTSTAFKPLAQTAKEKTSRFHEKISRWTVNLKNKQKEILKNDPEKSKMLLKDLLSAGVNAFELEQFEEAEKLFIEALTLAPRAKEIYYHLGELYRAQKNYPHALATFKHILNLELKNLEILEKSAHSAAIAPARRQIAAVYLEIAEIYYNQSETEKSHETMKIGLAYDENNPKYLDFFCELCIILKDKEEASSSLEKLRTINPENAKLDKLSQEIDNIQD